MLRMMIITHLAIFTIIHCVFRFFREIAFQKNSFCSKLFFDDEVKIWLMDKKLLTAKLHTTRYCFTLLHSLQHLLHLFSNLKALYLILIDFYFSSLNFLDFFFRLMSLPPDVASCYVFEFFSNDFISNLSFIFDKTLYFFFCIVRPLFSHTHIDILLRYK